jgi:hypothetical protein
MPSDDRPSEALSTTPESRPADRNRTGVDRRALLHVGGVGVLGLAAASKASATASTTDSDGDVGGPNNRKDVFADCIDARGVDTSSLTAERADIKEFPTARVYSSEFAGANPSERANNALAYVQSTYGGGTVVLPDGKLTQTETVTIPVPSDRNTPVALVAAGAGAVFVPDSSFSGTAIAWENTGSTNPFRILHNVGVNDVNGVASKLLDVVNGFQDRIVGGYWASSSADPLWALRGPDKTCQHVTAWHPWITRQGSGQTGIRLSDSNQGANGNWIRDCQIDGPAGDGTHVRLQGNNNWITGEFGYANHGIDVSGRGNYISARCEGGSSGFGDGGNQVNPIRFRPQAVENTVWCGTSPVWEYTRWEGRDNEVNNGAVKTVHDVTVGRAAIPSFLRHSGGGSVDVVNNQFRVQTENTDGQISRLDYGGNWTIDTTNGVVLETKVFPRDTNNFRWEWGVFRNSDNKALARYDPAAPDGVSGSNVVLETIDGGVSDVVDTGVAWDTSPFSLRVILRPDRTSLVVDTVREATAQDVHLHLAGWRFGIENGTVSSGKRVDMATRDTVVTVRERD